MTIDNGDNSNPFLTITTSHIEERFVREEKIKELYFPLLSTVVLKRKEERLYWPVDFNKNLLKDALADSNAYIFISAIAQRKMDRTKQQSPNNIFRNFEPPNIRLQKANGQLEIPLATTTPAIDVGDKLFAENLVVLKNMTGPFTGLHFMRYNFVVIYTTHGLIHFPQLTL